MDYVVRMSAGLANRMFQYSYYLYLKKLGKKVYVDNNYKYILEHENIDWPKIFPNAPLVQAPDHLIHKYGGGYCLIDKIRRHYLKKTCKVWIMKSASEIPSNNELLRNGYLIGVYQNAQMVEYVKDDVIKAFRFSDFQEGTYNAQLAAKMKEENSVAVHFRKGKDYMTREWYKMTCPIEYYENAVKLIMQKVKFPTFYVFTDNPDWVTKNFKCVDYTLVKGNPAIGWGNHFDLQLMSCCRHNIIANSTYSWWGAFLNQNTNKIVITPRHWCNPQISETEGINTVCKGWITL